MKLHWKYFSKKKIIYIVTESFMYCRILSENVFINKHGPYNLAQSIPSSPVEGDKPLITSIVMLCFDSDISASIDQTGLNLICWFGNTLF